MDSNKLSEIIREHKKWLIGDGGRRAYLQGADLQGANLQRADLRGADLRGAYLRGADLQGAYLQGAYLQGADLQGANLQRADLQGANLQRADLQDANLQRADLRGADLRGADLKGANLQRAYLQGTILDGINWLAYIGIVPNKSGVAYAYKVTTTDGTGIHYSGIDYINNDKFEEAVDTDVFNHCSYGINLATFAWCLSNFTDKTYRLFMFKFNVKDAVCPVASDGKFRVSKCTKVGECDWNGNLKN